MHCGWMDKSEWTKKDLPPSFGPFPYTMDVCPGWLVAQPAVIEGVHAYAARKDGCLEAFYPNCENIVLEATDIAVQAFNAYENEEVKKASKG